MQTGLHLLSVTLNILYIAFIGNLKEEIISTCILAYPSSSADKPSILWRELSSGRIAYGHIHYSLSGLLKLSTNGIIQYLSFSKLLIQYGCHLWLLQGSYFYNYILSGIIFSRGIKEKKTNTIREYDWCTDCFHGIVLFFELVYLNQPPLDLEMIIF